MDFDGAIKAHSEWKIKLQMYLKKPDGSLNPDVVCLDNQCALGKWLNGEGGKFATIPEFKTVKEEHAKFHKEAANIIRKASSGQSVTEEMALGAKSPYAAVSTNLVKLLMELKRKVAAA